MMDLLSVVLGMLLVFLVFALVVSRLREWLAQATCDRGTYLRDGIHRLIDDEAIATRVLQHPLVSGLYRDPKARGRPPSYVEPSTFAMALANVLVRRGAPASTAGSTANAQLPMEESSSATLDAAKLRLALESFARQRSPIASSLLPIIDRAGNDLEATLEGIEHWFESGMDRVSGWYKTRARRQLFWIGFAVAALVNVDAIRIFSHLNGHPDEAAKLALVAREVGATEKLGGIEMKDRNDRPLNAEEWKALMKLLQDRSVTTLPIGYACLGKVAELPAEGQKTKTTTWDACQDELRALGQLSPDAWLLKLIGWFITAFAGSLGASYWFAMLSKVVNIRSSGPPPQAKPQPG